MFVLATFAKDKKNGLLFPLVGKRGNENESFWKQENSMACWKKSSDFWNKMSLIGWSNLCMSSIEAKIAYQLGMHVSCLAKFNSDDWRKVLHL